MAVIVRFQSRLWTLVIFLGGTFWLIPVNANGQSGISNLTSLERTLEAIPEEFQAGCEFDICDIRVSYCDHVMKVCKSCEECHPSVINAIQTDRDVLELHCDHVCSGETTLGRYFYFFQYLYLICLCCYPNDATHVQ